MELLKLAKLPFEYENQDKLDAALERIPLERIYTAAEAATDSEYGFEDHLIMEMLKWFKEWFKWVNNAHCESCGSQSTTLCGIAAGSPEEAAYGGSRVEVYQCADCPVKTRFPRYNDPVKLLETQKGRCGEWANVFMLLIRALGLPARYVWNSEDHVWNEVYSSHCQRWIHIDSCEAAFDKPLTYTDGWGKKMAYVIGFSTTGAADISKRYIRRLDMQLERKLISEQQLKALLFSITATARDRFEPEDQVLWYERDEIEKAELESYSPSATETLPPRQSGSQDWVNQRGEGGSGDGNSAGSIAGSSAS